MFDGIIGSAIGTTITLLLGFILYKEKLSFKIIYEKRIVLLEKLYELLCKTNRSLETFTSTFQDDRPVEEKIKEFKKYFISLDRLFYRKKIILEENTCASIENIISLIDDAYKSYYKWDVSRKDRDRSNILMENWEKTQKKVFEEIPKVKKELEKEFRKSLRMNTF